jgi:hypothetical protein
VPWKTKFGQLHVKNTIFSRRAPQILPPRAEDALWRRLAPFQVLSSVLAVQCVITGRCRAVNQIIRENYQTVFGNSQTWQCLHTCHVEASEKVWGRYHTAEHTGHTTMANISVGLLFGERAIYLCEARLVRLRANLLKFFLWLFTPKLGAHAKS